MIQLAPIGAMLGRVPVWAWALAAALAWGAWHRHQARSERAEFEQAKVAAAAERAASAAEAAAESMRRRRVHQEVTDAAHLKAAQLERSLAASADAGRRLRAHLAAVDANRCARDSAIAGGSEAASASADLRAELSRRLDEAADGIAGFAERSATAGASCISAYEALRPAVR